MFCILGADSLLTIRKWHRAADLLLSCDFIVGARPGFHLAQARTALPPGLSVTSTPTSLPHTQLLELAGPGHRSTRLYLLTDLAEDVSATRIRNRIRVAIHDDTDPGDILNPAVAKYIRAQHLYRHL
jgi:nicotinate-nucleotide adenylyltransferase